MRKFASLFAFLFLAVFAANMVTTAAAGSAMARDMAMAGDGAMGVSDCQSCVAGGQDPATAMCDLVCAVSPVVALNGVVDGVDQMPLQRHDRLLAMALPRGLRAPPDPFPPRALI